MMKRKGNNFCSTKATYSLHIKVRISSTAALIPCSVIFLTCYMSVQFNYLCVSEKIVKKKFDLDKFHAYQPPKLFL